MADYSVYKFYRGERACPFRRGSLRRAVWEWERKCEEIFTDADSDGAAYAWWSYYKDRNDTERADKVMRCFTSRDDCDKRAIVKIFMDYNFPPERMPYLKQTRLYKGEPEDCNPYEHDEQLYMFHRYEACWVRFNIEDKQYIAQELKYYRHFIGEDFEANDGAPITFKAILLNRYLHWGGGTAEQFKEWYLHCPYHRHNYNK